MSGVSDVDRALLEALWHATHDYLVAALFSNPQNPAASKKYWNARDHFINAHDAIANDIQARRRDAEEAACLDR